MGRPETLKQMDERHNREHAELVARLDLVGVLRRHATILGGQLEVPRKDTAKLLRDAAKAIEILRALHWPEPKLGGEPCAKT